MIGVSYAEQARIVERVGPPHNCMQAINDDLTSLCIDMHDDLGVGTVVRCRTSCGRYYQRYGDGSSSDSPLWREVENRGTDQLPSWQSVEDVDVIALADEYERVRAERGRET